MKLEKPPKIENSNYLKYVLFTKEEENQRFLNEVDKKYFYWTELKHRPNLPLENVEELWFTIKVHRAGKFKFLFFHSHTFSYYLTDSILKDLHDFDLNLMGNLHQNSLSEEEKGDYLKTSLLGEAIASSQIEGAATTTEIAKEMIKSGRSPRNESEQMIFNNFYAIREIENRLEEELSETLILDIHRLMTIKTEAKKYAGKFRKSPIFVTDHIDGEVAHTAPDHEEVKGLVKLLCEFVNQEEEFVHPIIKASILHFIIAFIHPFGDGNGRTARALFYWFLMKKGYSLVKHISISEAILQSRISYDKAFLKTEYDDNDLTYFILYSIKTLRVAFQSLMRYRDRKREEKVLANKVIYELIPKGFSQRQADLLGYLSVKTKSKILISEFSKKHKITRQTASKDLVDLERKGILKSRKEGKNIVYELVNRSEITDLLE